MREDMARVIVERPRIKPFNTRNGRVRPLGFFLTLCDSRLIERASFERVTERRRRGHTWIV